MCIDFFQHKWNVEKLLGGGNWLQRGKEELKICILVRLDTEGHIQWKHRACAVSGTRHVSLVKEYLFRWPLCFLSVCSSTWIIVNSRVLWKRQQLSGKQTEPGFGPKAERKLCGWCRSPTVGLGYGASDHPITVCMQNDKTKVSVRAC